MNLEGGEKVSKLALPCIACGKPLKNVDEDIDNQPYGGTEFQSLGHYGSTIHDWIPGDPEKLYLIVNICDTCIMRAIDRGVIQSRSKEITLSRHPLTETQRAWVLAQNEKEYGSAWGEDTPQDYDALMQKAGWKDGSYSDNNNE
jgi:hypothetical protein